MLDLRQFLYVLETDLTTFLSLKHFIQNILTKNLSIKLSQFKMILDRNISKTVELIKNVIIVINLRTMVSCSKTLGARMH